MEKTTDSNLDPHSEDEAHKTDSQQAGGKVATQAILDISSTQIQTAVSGISSDQQNQTESSEQDRTSSTSSLFPLSNHGSETGNTSSSAASAAINTDGTQDDGEPPADFDGTSSVAAAPMTPPDVLAKNREKARARRERKRLTLEEMEKSVETLRAMNEQLRQTNELLIKELELEDNGVKIPEHAFPSTRTNRKKEE